jgi:hypothetical protein
MVRVNLLWFWVGVLLLTSCADIGITKRKFQPGYHWDIGKARKQQSGSVKSIPSVIAKKETPEMETMESVLLTELELRKEENLRQFKISAKLRQAVLVEEAKLSRFELQEDFATTIREAKKTLPKGSISDWSILAIVAFGFVVLGLIALILAIALLIHGATISGPSGVEFQRHGYRMSVATMAMGAIGFVTAFFALKDVKVRLVKSKAMAILSIIFGGIVMAVSLILTLIYFGIGGGG